MMVKQTFALSLSPANVEARAGSVAMLRLEYSAGFLIYCTRAAIISAPLSICN